MQPYHIPAELLHHILTDVLADSLHTVCTSDEESAWELNALHTLSLVSFTFRDVAEQVACKAFALSTSDVDGEDASTAQQFYNKLKSLQGVGMRSRISYTHCRLSLSPSPSSPLMRAYSLYLTAAALRRTADTVLDSARECVLDHLNTALKRCAAVFPRRMPLLLVRAIQDEIVRVHIGGTLVKAWADLKETLEKFPINGNGNNSEEHVHETYILKTAMHEALQRIESAESTCRSNFDFAYPTDQPLLTLDKLKITRVPDVVKDIAELTFDIDEYDICGRAEALVDKWSVPVGDTET